MKPEYLLFYILGTALIGCDTSSANRPETETKNNPGKEICREFTNDSQGKCTTKLRFISSNYVVKKGHVYWMTKTEHKETPCGFGMPFFSTISCRGDVLDQKAIRSIMLRNADSGVLHHTLLSLKRSRAARLY